MKKEIKKKTVTFILAVSLFSALAVSSFTLINTTSDKNNISAEAETADLTVNAADLLEGDENGNKNLDSPITRAEAAKLLCSVFNWEGSDSQGSFTDISSHWAKTYIVKAEENGIINGFEDKTFRPDSNITYEQAIKMILGENPNASYPQDYIAFAVDNELLDGISSIAGENITRGDVAQIIANLINMISSESADSYNSELLSEFSGAKILYELYASEGEDSSLSSALGSSSSTYSTASSSAGSTSSSSAGSVSILGGSSGGGSGGISASTEESSYDSSSYEVYAPLTQAPKSNDSNTDTYINPSRNSESYTSEDEGIFKSALLSPLSTFSIDTDTASYSNMRRFIVNGQTIPEDSIRSEEIINYFDYDLPQPTDGTPFSVTTEISSCPWDTSHELAMINIQGEKITERQPQNLVFLLDISGSMHSYNKLPLVKRSIELLLNQLDERDTVSIVTYANGSKVAASGLKGNQSDEIMNAVRTLRAGGGTNGEGGIELAYEMAEEFKCTGNNRIILCTDGDFNIGISDNDELKELISEKRSNGIFLSVMGFGIGNYKDDKLEIIADNGDGGYYYIDNLREAKKVLCDEMTSTLYTIAKDVKIQVEFNPAQVSQYRLIGYENRVLENEQFADDSVDAGELGAGANVTALYEIVPASDETSSASGDTLRYSAPSAQNSNELMNISLRYKLPDGDESILKEYPIQNTPVSETSDNFRMASAAAELGMILSGSEYLGTSTYDSAIALARSAYGDDTFGIRHEFVQLADILRLMR